MEYVGTETLGMKAKRRLTLRLNATDGILFNKQLDTLDF